MLKSDFNYELPPELIAQTPLAERTESRLLCLDGRSGELQDSVFTDLAAYLQPGDLLVFNDTKVIPARLFGQKQSGGKVEILVERILHEHQLLAHIRASKSPKPGTRIEVEAPYYLIVEEKSDALYRLTWQAPYSVMELLQRHGHIPLPPYIQRPDQALDQQRYQTVFARHHGAVAAPTAGLHFDRSFMQQLSAQGVEQGFVTLHVGAGTFQPVREEQIEQHNMHSEVIEVSEHLCEQIQCTQARGGRVVAVGTTVVRCLESAALKGSLQPYRGETSIFLYPGKHFRVVDALLTNFHLPESTLIMLVCAFAGYNHTMRAYQHAVQQHYRFFSYGDAMFVSHPQAR